MSTVGLYTLTSQEFQMYLNNAIALAAHEMVKDGLITDAIQVTDRYLAVVATKGTFAVMFESFFNDKDKKDQERIVVVRVDTGMKELTK